MSTLRKLTLLAAAAIAALAMTASAASAQTVEVHPEASANHCGAVTVDANHLVEGGCTVHAITEPGTTANLFTHIPGTGEVLFSSCNNEFEGHVNEDGLGFITDQVLTGANCGITACDEAAPSHAQLEWPLSAFEGGGGNEALATTFCVRPLATPPPDPQPVAEGDQLSYCSVVVDATQNDVEHTQEFSAQTSSCVESATELSGHWITDATEGEIDIEHAH